MKVAVLGTRGIPNNYGGFEQLAEFLAVDLVSRGHEVTVFNSHKHPYREPSWNGVTIKHCYDPEYKIGTAGQFIYDLNCIRYTRQHHFDVILQLGYTSSSIWSRLFPRRSLVITNMDGLEWKRTKYSPPVRRFLKRAERWGAMRSDFLIADSIGIQDYLQETYGKSSEFIPYGAHLFNDPDPSVLKDYNVEPYGYDLLIARMEPENNVETVIKGHILSGVSRPLLIIGGVHTPAGKQWTQQYVGDRVRFCGPNYDMAALNNLRYHSHLYFHGHSVGGTNPSLLEAMASNALICAHDNEFNRHILNDDAVYFSDEGSVSQCIGSLQRQSDRANQMVESNLDKISRQYNWASIVSRYEDYMVRCLDAKKSHH